MRQVSDAQDAAPVKLGSVVAHRVGPRGHPEHLVVQHVALKGGERRQDRDIRERINRHLPVEDQLLGLVGAFSSTIRRRLCACAASASALSAFGMGTDQRPEFTQLPEALPSFYAWSEAVAGARPDERFGGVTGQPGGT